jgi:hypothetical protein
MKDTGIKRGYVIQENQVLKRRSALKYIYGRSYACVESTSTIIASFYFVKEFLALDIKRDIACRCNVTLWRVRIIACISVSIVAHAQCICNSQFHLVDGSEYYMLLIYVY